MKLDNKNVKAIVDSLYLHYGEVISTALAAYKRTNGTKYKLLLEQYRAGDAVFEKLYNDVIQKQLKTFIENDNAVYPQYKGLDLQEFSSKTPHKTDDIVAMRKEIFETTAQAFKIPLSMMYGNITNMNEIVKVYLSFCIDPLADMISEEFTRKYYSFDEWKAGNYIKVDTSCINHVDILEVANEVYNLVGAGFSLDELRDRLDKQKLNTEFSRTHFLSKNFVPAEDMLNSEIPKGGE
jgi:HK97 family phage portal protein